MSQTQEEGSGGSLEEPDSDQKRSGSGSGSGQGLGEGLCSVAQSDRLGSVSGKARELGGEARFSHS